mgnify:CR=1 FL=1
MNRDLTSSKIARQNVLNNKYALQEIQKAVGLPGIIFRGQLVFTKQQVASFFGVSQRSINTCIRNNDEELALNGYEILKGNVLKNFKLACRGHDVREVNFTNKTHRVLNNQKSNIPPKFRPIQEGKISDFSDLR